MLQLVIDFFSVWSTIHWSQSHLPSSRPLLMASNHDVGFLRLLLESKSCKGPRSWHFSTSKWSLGIWRGIGEIKSHEIPLTIPLVSLISVAIGSLREVMNLVQSELSWEGNENRGLTGRLVDLLPLGNKRLLWSSLISFPHASCHLLYLGWVLRAPLGGVQITVLNRLFFFFFLSQCPPFNPLPFL